MRKRLIAPLPPAAPLVDQPWIDVGKLAAVEVTSEDKSYPVESALLLPTKGSWRASDPGRQTVRLVFDNPQKLRDISLVFEETKISRTQEFVLRWSPDGGRSFQEVVRQQWSFSPPGTVREEEDYVVELSGVTVLELNILPDISGGEARASLERLWLA
jgi:hypothetical protein